MKILKGVAIIFMLLLHLFCRKDVNGLYETFPEYNGVPLIYYIGLFGDACVPIYCFASGYGLFMVMNKELKLFKRKNSLRIFKLLINFWIILLIYVIISFLLGKVDVNDIMKCPENDEIFCPHFDGNPVKKEREAVISFASLLYQ